MFTETSFFDLMLACGLVHLIYFVLYRMCRKVYVTFTNFYRCVNNTCNQVSRIANKFEYALESVDRLCYVNDFNNCENDNKLGQITSYLKNMDLHALVQTILSFGSYFMNWYSLFRSIQQQSWDKTETKNILKMPCKCNGHQQYYCDLDPQFKYQPLESTQSNQINDYPFVCPSDNFQQFDRHSTGLLNDSTRQQSVVQTEPFYHPEPALKRNTMFQTLAENVSSLLSGDTIRTYGVPLALKTFELYQKKKMDDMLASVPKVESKDSFDFGTGDCIKSAKVEFPVIESPFYKQNVNYHPESVSFTRPTCIGATGMTGPTEVKPLCLGLTGLTGPTKPTEVKQIVNQLLIDQPDVQSDGQPDVQPDGQPDVQLDENSDDESVEQTLGKSYYYADLNVVQPDVSFPENLLCGS